MGRADLERVSLLERGNFPACLEEIAAKQAHGTVIEIWFADDARIGQGRRRRPVSAPLHNRGPEPHLKEIAQAVAPGAHAVVLLDQAGWHRSKRLVVPPN